MSVHSLLQSYVQVVISGTDIPLCRDAKPIIISLGLHVFLSLQRSRCRCQDIFKLSPSHVVSKEYGLVFLSLQLSRYQDIFKLSPSHVMSKECGLVFLSLQRSRCQDIFKLSPSHVVSKECGLVFLCLQFSRYHDLFKFSPSHVMSKECGLVFPDGSNQLFLCVSLSQDSSSRFLSPLSTHSYQMCVFVPYRQII